ncbi:hypothetical protein BJX96DRAFT_179434 [Aspergillus floccosus]
MTVERCVEVAQGGYWRYAGVEFGTQCFVGNTLHGPDQFPDSDCSQACAGDGTQACGAGGRIQVYEDLTWRNPTLDELIAAVERYNATMEQVRQVIASYQGHINELQDLLQSQPSAVGKRKRQQQPFENIEMEIRKDYSAVETGSINEETDREAGNEILTRGRQRDTVGEANAPVPETIFEEWGVTGDNVARYLGQIRTRLAGILDELERANQASTVPQIDAAAAAAEAQVALQAIGVAGSAVIISGFFLVLGNIVSFFKGLGLPGGGDGGQSSTIAATTSIPTTMTSSSSTTTTTSTSICTATATTTPVAIFATSGTSAAEFETFISTLPEDPRSLTLTESWLPNFLYAGFVDGCSIEKLDNDPVIAYWTISQGSQPVWAFVHDGPLTCHASTAALA